MRNGSPVLILRKKGGDEGQVGQEAAAHDQAGLVAEVVRQLRLFAAHEGG